MKKRHINIPIFIPHLGCPNGCVFCNQRSISGHLEFQIEDVERDIDEALSTIGEEDSCEIAFFGGSFTGIDRSLMIALLDIAQGYCDRGRVEAIRLSTRPDYIDSEILDILKKYSVRTVELGLQSMDSDVLLASKRGHTAKIAEDACRMVKEWGFELIGQMMIGLPSSDVEKEKETERRICALGADGARVYPTVVFYDTELAEMTAKGEYIPLDTDGAVRRTKEVLDIFDRQGVPCIRVGLCSGENLADETKVMGGANHAAIGELAMGELYFDRICAEIERCGFFGGELTVYVAEGNVSKAVGQKKKNKLRICEKYGFSRVKVLEKKSILSYNILLKHFPRKENNRVSEISGASRL